MEEDQKPQSIFVCPTHGEVDNEDVAFLCNTCDLRESKIVDGVYVCPQCETHLHPFQCRICDQDVSWQTPLNSTQS